MLNLMICVLFLSQTCVDSYSTRLSTQGSYCTLRVKRSGTKSFRYIGSKHWNNLSADISKLKEYKPFKDTFLLPKVV